jgi:hypothetical protein
VNDYGIGEVEDYAVEMLITPRCDPGTTFYYVDGGTSPSGNGATGNATINSLNVSNGTVTTVYDPPTLGGTDSINGLAVDSSRGVLLFQNSGLITARGIYSYSVFTSQLSTVTTDASTAPFTISGLGQGWRSAAGAFSNGKYYVGIDGDDSGNIWEVTLNATGTTPVSARQLITNPNGSPFSCPNWYCNDYGDILVDGNRMYVTVAQSLLTPPAVFEVWDINSQLLLNRQTIPLQSGDAFQLGRDGNGNIWAISSQYGSVYTVTNGSLVWNNGTPRLSINRYIRDASECIVTRTPTAVRLSSFSARTEMFDSAGSGIAAGAVGVGVLAAAFGFIVWRRNRKSRHKDNVLP